MLCVGCGVVVIGDGVVVMGDGGVVHGLSVMACQL